MELVFDSTSLYGGHKVREQNCLVICNYDAVGLNRIIKVLDKRGQKATKNRAIYRVLSSPSSSVAPLDAPSWAVSAPRHISATASLESEVS